MFFPDDQCGRRESDESRAAESKTAAAVVLLGLFRGNYLGSVRRSLNGSVCRSVGRRLGSSRGRFCRSGSNSLGSVVDHVDLSVLLVLSAAVVKSVKFDNVAVGEFSVDSDNVSVTLEFAYMSGDLESSVVLVESLDLVLCISEGVLHVHDLVIVDLVAK